MFHPAGLHHYDARWTTTRSSFNLMGYGARQYVQTESTDKWQPYRQQSEEPEPRTWRRRRTSIEVESCSAVTRLTVLS
jgi:hypothetical protein